MAEVDLNKDDRNDEEPATKRGDESEYEDRGEGVDKGSEHELISPASYVYYFSISSY